MKPKEIQDLLEFIAQSGLEEVSLETEQFKLAVKRSMGFVAPQQIAAPVVQAPVQPQIQAPVATPAIKESTEQTPTTTESSAANNLIAIKSPMIGTFYAASGPDSPNFVSVGDEITKGQVVCIIEAMKLFNEIESDISGRVVKILVSNATPVEFDQPLFLVEPK